MKQQTKTHWYSVQTTPSLRRGEGIIGYYVVLREYRKAINRDGKVFNKWLGFVHITHDVFPTRKEALAFGRVAMKERTGKV